MHKYSTVDLNIFLSLILLMIIIMINKKQTYKSFSTRLFLLLCLSTVFLLILDALLWVFNGVNPWLVQILTYANYLAEPIPLLIWLCYLDYHLNQSSERLRKRLYYMQPFIFISILMIINVFTGFIFTVDSGGMYRRGPGIPLILAMNFGIILFTIFTALRHRKELEQKVFTVVVLFGIIPILGGLLQLVTYGITILWNAVALSVIFIYLFLETQKEIRDYLTGLLNRQQIDELIISRMIDYEKKGSFSLIMLDMDDFKEINDQFGHKEGDRALVRLSEILHNSVKGIDNVARFGGDEFIILLEEDRPAMIIDVIERIQETLTEENTINGRPYNLAVSAGFTVYSPEVHKDFTGLLSDADQRMYSDKLLKKSSAKVLKA